jgi:hypothetical protein
MIKAPRTYSVLRSGRVSEIDSSEFNISCQSLRYSAFFLAHIDGRHLEQERLQDRHTHNHNYVLALSMIV